MENDSKPKKRKNTARKIERTIVARELFPPEFCHFGSITPLSSTDEGNPVIPRIPLLPDTMIRKRQMSSEEQENVPRKLSAKTETQTRDSIKSCSTEKYVNKISDEAEEVAVAPPIKVMKASRRTRMRARAPSVACSSYSRDSLPEPGLDSKSYAALASSYAALATASTDSEAITPHFLSSLSTVTDAPIAAESPETQDSEVSPTHPTVATKIATQIQSQEEECVKSTCQE